MEKTQKNDNKDDNGDFIAKLADNFPEEAIQRTLGSQTRKGYDTTGYGYQFAIDRFNNVCGSMWGFDYKILKEVTGAYKSGQPYYDITVEMMIWVRDPETARKCVGGHISGSYADALKGAITNSFKKTAAFWGVGRQAYAGTIDDDNVPQKEGVMDVESNFAAIKKIIDKITTSEELLRFFNGLSETEKKDAKILEVFSFKKNNLQTK